MSQPSSGQIERVVVLGGGSAGLLSALALKSRFPGLQVQLIHSKEIGIIGVGEGSTLVLTRFLHETLKVDLAEFFQVAQPTWKLGLKYLWGSRPYFNYTFATDQLVSKVPGLPRNKAFYSTGNLGYEHPLSAFMSENRAFAAAPNGGPQFHANFAYHFENEKFVSFLERRAVALGVSFLEDTVADVAQDEQGISALRLASGRTVSADLFIDASGFRSLLLGSALGEPFESYDSSLFCDRAVVGGWDRQGAEDACIKPYTTCETMDNGWCWQIEHERRINRGSVYASAFVSDEQAEAEFRSKNPKITQTRMIKFVSGRRRRLWVKNVVAMGNAGGFVEPLEATALGTICTQCRLLGDLLVEANLERTEFAPKTFNIVTGVVWDDIRDFLSVHYKFNTRSNTTFWQAVRADTDLAGAKQIVQMYKEHGPNTLMELAIPRPSQFQAAGYIALLCGQDVEYEGRRELSPAERKLWVDANEKCRQAALHAMSIKDVLATIRSPGWKWGNPAAQPAPRPPGR